MPCPFFHLKPNYQLPIRFDLKYRAADDESDAKAEKFKRPIIVHRAMLGSVERMSAILIEHYAGKWPFWLSPRQCLVVPVGKDTFGYANEVYEELYKNKIFADVDNSSKTLNKKVREGQLAQYNLILVVGAKEQENRAVNIRSRDNAQVGTKSIAEAIEWMKELKDTYSPDF
jgi:threonyl-tRNA synthetase